MKALVFKVGQKPKLEDIKNELDVLKEIVGGWIECVGIDDGVVLICNEEGKLLDLEPNRELIINEQIVDIVCGNFIICGTDGEEFDDLSDEMIKKWKFIYKRLEAYNKYKDITIED